MKVRKRLMSGLSALALAVATVLTVAVPVAEVHAAPKAVTTTGRGNVNFTQQFAVANANSDSLISGIATPSFTYEYTMTPVLQDIDGSDLDSTIYAITENEYPAGPATDKIQVMQISGIGKGATSDSNGLVEYAISVEDLYASTPTFGTNDKVYRYQLTISGVYLEAADGTLASPNLLNGGMSGLFTIPEGDIAILCDLYVDGTGEIAGGVFYDASGTKIEGFASENESEVLNTAFIPTALSSGNKGVLTYNVYNAYFSSDYIGENMTSNDISYEVKFANLPWWLTGTQLLTQSGALIKGNSTEWQAADGGGTTFDGTSTISGSFVPKGGSVTFVGIPVIGFDFANAPTMEASLQYTSINGATSVTNASQLDKYGTRLYGATKAGRANSYDSLIAFNQSNLKALYNVVSWAAPTGFPLGTNSTSTEAYKTTALSLGTITASSNEDMNSIRYVMFDPSDAIIVGVTMDFLPGVLMIGLAIGGAVAFGLSRRRDVVF